MIDGYQEVIESTAHLIMEFAQTGGASRLPQVFKIGAYWVYFWANENDPPEPVHVHIAEGAPVVNATKVWIAKSGKCLRCNNNSHISEV